MGIFGKPKWAKMGLNGAILLGTRYLGRIWLTWRIQWENGLNSPPQGEIQQDFGSASLQPLLEARNDPKGLARINGA
jgi:hypothetical protein